MSKELIVKVLPELFKTPCKVINTLKSHIRILAMEQVFGIVTLRTIFT